MKEIRMYQAIYDEEIYVTTIKLNRLTSKTIKKKPLYKKETRKI